MSPFAPRNSQQKVLAYTGGRLGISAVPGSGKTHTLSQLAANLIADGCVSGDQEVLVVTLVNSAVQNFSSRISGFLEERGLLPRQGYRVRTLHGLAHDIVGEDPGLLGLDPQFTIVDETVSAALVRDAAASWTNSHPDFSESYIATHFEGAARRNIVYSNWPTLVEKIAVAFIRSAKDRRLTPEALAERASSPSNLPLFEMGLAIYTEYQHALGYRGAVDFDDLVRLAADLLQASPELAATLRHKWPYVLEDEAQDSTRVQEQILRSLSGKGGNWVRVGDPNQAIFETFTTADPELLRAFVREHSSVDMPESGRSQASILALANQLIDWSLAEHPYPEVRGALQPPHIIPAPAGDAQQNPENDPGGILFASAKRTPAEEISAVSDSIAKWLPSHRDWTVAVISQTNDHAARMAQALEGRGIAYHELLRSTSATRAAATAIANVLTFLNVPEKAGHLADAYKAWHVRHQSVAGSADTSSSDRIEAILRAQTRVEEFLAPDKQAINAQMDPSLGPKADALLSKMDEAARAATMVSLNKFRDTAVSWLQATVLPIDQLIITIGADIFGEASDLAVAHKLALVLADVAEENPAWRLGELLANLKEIARNERKFLGFSADDEGFDPNRYRGVVLVSTMHKAKGLEWDRVYLLSVNDYDFPCGAATEGANPGWFVRNSLNLEAECGEQLRAATGEIARNYEEGKATERSRLDTARERLRLLYVGITRAKRELVLSWNTGRRGNQRIALSLEALQDWWYLRQIETEK